MKISIITVTYNSAATIRDTLDCITKQDYASIEHIIIDGASTDQTLEIVKDYPLAKIVSEPDNGIYDAMNKGLNLATGDIIGILNSDDFYAHHQVISKVIRVFETEQVDTLYGDLQYVSQKDVRRIVRHWKAGAFHRANFHKGWMPPHPTFFVRRHIYERFGIFDTSFRNSADYELMLRFLLKNKVSTYYLPEVLVKMRTGGQSNITLRNRLRANLEDRRAWEKNGLQPRFYTMVFKPLLKLSQYFYRNKKS